MANGLRLAASLVLALQVAWAARVVASEANVPDKILPQLAWSFKEPVPASVEDLIKQLDAYAKSIKETLNKRGLQRVFPGKQLDIQYKYATQRPTGQWDTLKVVVRVKERGKPLTYGEILLQLHQASHQHLKGEDHHYFEGLYRLSMPF